MDSLLVGTTTFDGQKFYHVQNYPFQNTFASWNHLKRLPRFVFHLSSFIIHVLLSKIHPPAEVPGLWSLNPTTVENPRKQSSWSCVVCRLLVSTFGWPKKMVDIEEIWCELNIQDHTQYDSKLYVYIVLGTLTKLLCIGFFCIPMVLFMNLDSVSSTLGSWD